VTMPTTLSDRMYHGATLVPRISMALARTAAILPFFGAASMLAHQSSRADPTHIARTTTPILLIHGSSTNQRQWDVFRCFLANQDVGHIFALSLNKRAFANETQSIREYAHGVVATKLRAMRQLYADANLELNDAIVIGHSMGGLIAGQLAVDNPTDVGVSTVISLNTPWNGSWIADKKYNAAARPESAFRTDSPETATLRAQLFAHERAGTLKLHTFSGSLDPLVRGTSSSLAHLPPAQQMYSTVHDHLSIMLDPFVTADIRQRWILPNTRELPTLSTSATSS
jgi:pimeloyl-ACP methyl ester carboxylesterase